MENRLYKKVISLLYKEHKSALLESTFAAVFKGVGPFIYILYPGVVLYLWNRGVPFISVMEITLAFVGVKTILQTLQQYLSNKAIENRDNCNLDEKRRTCEKLFDIDYQDGFEGKYANLVQKHRQASSVYGSIMRSTLLIHEEMISAWIACGISVASLLVSIKGIADRDTLLLLLIELVAGLSCICILLGKGFIQMRRKLNQKKESLRKDYLEESARYEQIKLQLSNYRSGKEIRVFHIQEYIQRVCDGFMFGNGLKIQNQMVLCKAKSDVLGECMSLFSLFSVYVSTAIICYYVEVPASVIVVVVGSLIELINQVRKLLEIMTDIEDVSKRAELFFAVLDASSEKKDLKYERISPNVIKLENVTYRYQSGFVALNGVNLSIKKGEKIAIVGENGSGKTTLAMVILGLFHPTTGVCYIEQTPSSNKKSNTMGVMFQEYQIYSLSLAENIAMQLQYDKERIESLLYEVEFPGNVPLDTILFKEYEEDGVELSGGEQQKIAIARSLYQDGNIVLMDEPTASLDPYSEKKVVDKINDMINDKTVIFISHRMSACRFCDRILVLDKGKIVQNGTHQQLLMDKDGKYRELWNAQAKYYE